MPTTILVEKGGLTVVTAENGSLRLLAPGADAVARHRAPEVISHRTHMGQHPENSWPGLEAALASGVDGVEVDVRATQDGHVVLLHDRSLARTHAVPYPVDELTLDELQRVTAGAGPVPLLADALARCDGRPRLVVDVKQRGIAVLLQRLIEARPGTETWVWTHDGAIARECIDVFKGTVPVSLIVRPELVSLWGRPKAMRLARKGGLDGLLFEHPDVDWPLLERAAKVGLTLHCGRTNEPEDIARLRSLPIASICSDFPERVLAATEFRP